MEIFMSKFLKSFANQPLACICIRFNYRGKVTGVGDDFLKLSDSRTVLETGPSDGTEPQSEVSNGPRPVYISLRAAEINGYQPNWCRDSIESEDEYSEEGPQTLAEVLEAFKGERAAILCARYHYRGVVEGVEERTDPTTGLTIREVVLSNPRSVEVAEPGDKDSPGTEDEVGSSISINLDAVEMVHQPNWLDAPLSVD